MSHSISIKKEIGIEDVRSGMLRILEKNFGFLGEEFTQITNKVWCLKEGLYPYQVRIQAGTPSGGGCSIYLNDKEVFEMLGTLGHVYGQEMLIHNNVLIGANLEYSF